MLPPLSRPDLPGSDRAVIVFYCLCCDGGNYSGAPILTRLLAGSVCDPTDGLPPGSRKSSRQQIQKAQVETKKAQEHKNGEASMSQV